MERTGQRQYILGEGLRLGYRAWGVAGGRLPLVLLHGLTGCADDWERLAPTLAAERWVIALDARGHGASEWSAEAAYAGDAHFADVARALDGLGVGRCLLAGFSMGGGVAILTAAALPERVAGLAVIDAYPAAEMTAGSRRIAEAVASFAAVDASAHPFAAALGWRERPGFDPAIAQRFADDLANGQEARLDLWPFWRALVCPTLLVRGEESDVLPEPLAAAMLACQPLARLATVAGVAHELPFRAPERLAALLTEFADGVG